MYTRELVNYEKEFLPNGKDQLQKKQNIIPLNI